MPEPRETKHRAVLPHAAFQHRDFRLFQVARLSSILATETQSLAVGWLVYSITHRAIDLGYVGLAQFLPALVFLPFSGHTADRFDKRRILMICNASLTMCAAFLYWYTQQPQLSVRYIFLVLVVIGTIRAFATPASQSITPNLVPPEHFSNAMAWGSSIFMTATIAGPAVGGLLYGMTDHAAPVFGLAAILDSIAFLFLTLLHVRTGRKEHRDTSLETLLAGFRYVWNKKVILGSISLDLFAVFLGGAVALLPIFAKDVLHVGALGMGVLRASSATGAALTGLFLAFRPVTRRNGVVMMWCVAIFGVGTIVFGLSRSFLLSVAALAVLGASDMVSVVIRATLVQIATPEEMRGRVSAVNLLFIGASNELGEFESGLTAQWFGAVPAVILGGIGTLIVVSLWAWKFPELRKVDSLHPEMAGRA